MYYFCTYFDQHYLDKGLALYHSLVRRCSPFQLWILCMDDATYQILSEMQLPQVHLITLTKFEEDNQLLLKAKQNRSLIEYYFTCTPSLPIYVLDHAPEVDIITYLDADLYFFSSIEPIYQELGNGSVLLIGHRFPPALKVREIYGIYNVGLLSFRRDNNGLTCLEWWRDRCLEWCYDRLENSRFADQKYLDDWPSRFAGVIVLQYKGAGLAPWNIANYTYSSKNRGFLVDGQPIIMYHFHGLKRINQWLYDTNISVYKTRLPKEVRLSLYYPYIKELNHIKHELHIFPKFNLDTVQSIRVHIEASMIQMTIRNIIQKVYAPLKYLQKLLYKDIILCSHRNDF